MHARNLAQDPGVDEVVLLGRDPGRLGPALDDVRAAIALDAPASLAGAHAPAGEAADVRIGDGLDSELPALDGIVIATNTASHPELTLRAARAGVPTLVEKPLTLDLERLESLADELDRFGTPVMVAFHRRYDPAHQELRRRVRAGDAGTVRAVHGIDHDRLPLSPDYIPHSGGIWRDLLIHDFDSIPWVTGRRVTRVWATGAVLDAPVHAEHDDVDTASATLVLDSGAIADVTGLRRNGAGQDVRLEVFGSLDSFGAGLDAHTPITSTEPGGTAPEAPHEQFIERFERAFRAEIAAFVRVANGELDANLTPPRAGLDAIRIAQAAAESCRTGRPVDVTTTTQ